jgi:hypothetical protein
VAVTLAPALLRKIKSRKENWSPAYILVGTDECKKALNNEMSKCSLANNYI